MSKAMKVLIAYDGSTCADEAITDLQRAGLPANVEATVLSVADVWLLPKGESVAPPRLGPSATMSEARQTAAQLKARADELAATGTARVQELFPTWTVAARTATDSPAWAIILAAEEWGAELIVVGSHGYSPLGRWVLGSVSQAVLTHAHTSVRIARGRPTPPASPLRILVGIDGSMEADLAARTVAQRSWPAGTDIRLMLVQNPSLIESIHANARNEVPVPMAEDTLDARDWEEMGQDEVEEIDALVGRMFDSYTAMINQHAPDVTISTSLQSGDPKRAIVEEAETWGADCIFIGSRGLNRLERLLLGSVSSAVASRAECSVEVVRSPHVPEG